jgi:hypothetical protein
MSTPTLRGRTGAQSDTLTALEFTEELRYAGRLDTAPAVDNPVAAALVEIEARPFNTQSRVLARMLTALTYGAGDFRVAEISALDVPTRRIVLALSDASISGTTPHEVWVKAVEAAGAAELAARG